MNEFVGRAVGRAALPIAVTISVLFTIMAWLWLRQDLGGDFGVYWRTASQPVERAYEHRAALNFAYPPTMLLWVAPLGLLSPWAAFGLWSAVGILGLAAACLKHLTRPETALALISPPVVYCLLSGQVSVALAALLLWACGTNNRIAAGIALAVIASIKPQLVIMAPLLLLATRDRAAMVSGLVASVLLLSASALAFGIEPWREWHSALGHFQAVVIKNGVLPVTITPASVAQMKGWPVAPAMLAGAAIGAWLVIKCREAPPLEKAAAIATGSLLASPYAVMYDLAALVPFLVWTIFRGGVLAAIILPGSLNPLPLLVTAFLLSSAKVRARTQQPLSPI